MFVYSRKNDLLITSLTAYNETFEWVIGEDLNECEHLSNSSLCCLLMAMLLLLRHSVVSDSPCPCGLYLAGHLWPWNFPGENTGAGCHFLFQGIFLTQGSNLCFMCSLHYILCEFFTHWAIRRKKKKKKHRWHGASLIAQLVNNLAAMQEIPVNS